MRSSKRSSASGRRGARSTETRPPPPQALERKCSRSPRAPRPGVGRDRRPDRNSVVAELPRPDPRAVARLADAIGGRSANEGYQAFHRDLYDWLAAYAREFAPPSFQVERIGELWDRIRAAERETEALNLDRRLHILAVFAEIAASAPRR